MLGSDGAGVVASAGPGVARFKPGEYTVAAEDGKVSPFPGGLPFAVAAALPTASVTAYQAIRAAGLRAGQTILLNTNHAAENLARQDIRGINAANHATAEDLAALAEQAAAGKLRVRIETEASLDDAPAVIEKAKAGHATGKTVITVA